MGDKRDLENNKRGTQGSDLKRTAQINQEGVLSRVPGHLITKVPTSKSKRRVTREVVVVLCVCVYVCVAPPPCPPPSLADTLARHRAQRISVPGM